MTQALPGPGARSLLREHRRLQVRRARARIFRGRHHAAAMGAVLLVVLAAFRAFPGHDVLVVSENGARIYHTVFSGEAAAIPDLYTDQVVRAREFRQGAITGISIASPTELTVDVDGRVIRVLATASTVGGALAEAGVTLGPRDRVRLAGVPVSPSTPLRGIRLRQADPAAAGAPGEGTYRLEVARARPYTVWLDAMRLEVLSPAATVGSSSPISVSSCARPTSSSQPSMPS